jgi:hypothetical protein
VTETQKHFSEHHFDIKDVPLAKPEPDPPKKFWCVLEQDGTVSRGSLVMQSSREKAESEAIRLSKQERKIFYVLEAIECIRPMSQVERVNLG